MRQVLVRLLILRYEDKTQLFQFLFNYFFIIVIKKYGYFEKLVVSYPGVLSAIKLRYSIGLSPVNSWGSFTKKRSVSSSDKCTNTNDVQTRIVCIIKTNIFQVFNTKCSTRANLFGDAYHFRRIIYSGSLTAVFERKYLALMPGPQPMSRRRHFGGKTK